MEKKKSSAGIVIAIIIASVIIAGGAVAAALIIHFTQQPSGGDEPDEPVVVEQPRQENDNPNILSSDHVRGKRDSKVLVLEYADPQCPGCASMMPKMEKIYEKYKDKVAFVYRHYPITGHQNAQSAAIAIEAAGKQGYFWEMLTAMFDRRADWIPLSGSKLTNAYAEIFNDVTKKKGDTNQFEKDLSDKELSNKVSNDKKHGSKDGVTYTPSFYINGKLVEIDKVNDIQKEIEDKIEEALNE